MTHPANDKSKERKYPFTNLNISDYSILMSIKDRSACFKCGKSRKYFCYSCYVPIAALRSHIPKVRLPVKIDILKHPTEIGKSTAVHAPILAPDDVRIYTYPDIPDYSKEDGVVLIYPCSTGVTISQLFDENVQIVKEENFGLPKGHHIGTLLKVRLQEDHSKSDVSTPTTLIQYTHDNLPVKKAVFIDSTWNTSKGIYHDPRVKNLKAVVLQNRISQFWRHQKGSPRWYLATIEAIHEFLLEVHINAWGLNDNYRGLDELEISGDSLIKMHSVKKVNNEEQEINRDNASSPYNGQYDDLLYFFAHMYDLIHIYYDHNTLKSYKRPI